MLNKIAILIGMFMLAAGAAACSGNDDNATKTPSVQSQSGLSVAFALQAGQRAQDRAASSSTEQGTAASGATYAEGQPSQVQVYATVSITYAIQ